ncbi:MAG: hypothetical protein IJP48_04265 [Synergistaceae bacterium]|nr:hypothetical protein [Synergistaceae bacterium]
MKAVKVFSLFLLVFVLIISANCVYAAEAVDDPDNNAGSSRQMMGEIEKIIYGYVSQGGLIERLNKVEEDLFGRGLPGTIAERHAAILNFLDVGTDSQPSMLFKLGVAEWVVDKKINASVSVVKRLENLETNLTGATRTGNPIVMRVESLLATLIMDPVMAAPVTVPANTVLKFRFLDELSPGKSKAGDVVRIELTSDLIVNQHLVAPAGSLLLSDVREVKRPKRFGIPGEVRLSFFGLKPLGPQKIQVSVGKEAEEAIKEARKVGDRGEGAIVSAGAATVAGAALLGPVGLVSGIFIRGNSLKIAEGSVTYMQTAEASTVAAYPIPEALQVSDHSISAPEPQSSNTPVNYDPNRDTIIKGDVFNRNSYGMPTNSGTINRGGEFELPPEQQIN